MLSSESLSTVLYALALGRVDDAVDLVRTSGDINEDLRATLLDVMSSDGGVSEKARRLGDELRSRGADRSLPNECYRVAFYSGEWWKAMSDNPLFAYFSANRSGAPLDKWIHYFPIYARHLDRYRGSQVRVLEIGVYRGGGLELLKHYLGPGAQLVGVDVDERAKDAARGRYVVELGDQQDASFLREVNERHGPFDVVIDDGGHAVDQQVVTVETLFPLLSEGGTFVVEDCHTSYWLDKPQYAPAAPGSGSFIDWVKSRIDDLNAYHFSTEPVLSTPWTTHVDAMHLYDSVVVLDKRERFAPFSEVSGVAAFITQPRQMSAHALDLLAAREMSVSTGPGAAEVLAVRDAALVRAELFELKAARAETSAAELTRLQTEVAELRSVVRRMRDSRSWRLTAPLRSMSRAGRGG